MKNPGFYPVPAEKEEKKREKKKKILGEHRGNDVKDRVPLRRREEARLLRELPAE